MRYARVGHSGPVIAVQHVPVLPSGTADCPYGYTNADDIVSLMEEHAIALAVAGHYHAGTPLIHHGKCAYLVVKALCESPFTFTVITIDDHEVTAVDEHTLDREIPSRSPGAYGTVDQDGEVSTSDAEASDP